MGNLLNRLNNNNNAVEETETTNNYKYPPKSGELKTKFPFNTKKHEIIFVVIFIRKLFFNKFYYGW